MLSKKFTTMTAIAAIACFGAATAQEQVTTETEAEVQVKTEKLSPGEVLDEVIEEADLTDAEAGLDATTRAEINEMNKIVSVLIDAEALYTDAAEIPDNEDGVRNWLDDLAAERAAQREALQARVALLGGEADEFGEATGTTHRVFTQIRTAFSDDTEVAVEEVLRGERYIVEQIGEALTGDLTPEGEQILIDLRADIEADIEMLEEIDDAV